MAIDSIAISAIVISVFGALVTLVKTVHLQKCHSACCDSDCRESRKRTPPETPIDVQPARLEISEV